MLPNLLLPLLDIYDVLGINFVGAVYPHSYLIDVVGNVADELVDLVKLFLVQMNNTALEDHRSDKLAP